MTPTSLLRFSTTVTLFLALAACSKGASNDGSGDAPAAAQALPDQAKEAVANALPEEVAKAAEQAAASPPGAPNGEPVDVCKMLETSEVEALVGPLLEGPKAGQAQGSLLGECSWMSKSMVLISISARPAAEYKQTLEYATKKAPAQPVTVPGAEAARTSLGLFVQPSGKPYFLQVIAGNAKDPEVGAKLASKLKF